jgi:hypothetical protein
MGRRFILARIPFASECENAGCAQRLAGSPGSQETAKEDVTSHRRTLRILAVALLAWLLAGCGGSSAGRPTTGSGTAESGGDVVASTESQTTTTTTTTVTPSGERVTFALRTFCGPRVCPQVGTARILSVQRTATLDELGLSTVAFSTDSGWFPSVSGDYIVLTAEYTNHRSKRIDLSWEGQGLFYLGLAMAPHGSGWYVKPLLTYSAEPSGFTSTYHPVPFLYADGSATWKPCVVPAGGSTRCQQYIDLSVTDDSKLVTSPADLYVAAVSDATVDILGGTNALFPSSELISTLDQASGQPAFRQVGPPPGATIPDSPAAAQDWVNGLLNVTDANCNVFTGPSSSAPLALEGYGTVYHCYAQIDESNGTSLCAAMGTTTHQWVNVSTEVDQATGAETTYC